MNETINMNKKNIAIQEIKSLKKKLHLYTEDNRELVEKRIRELVKKYNITYGDIFR